MTGSSFIPLLGALLFLEALVLGLARHPRTARFFDFLPAVFWIYFLPMLLATAGWLPGGAQADAQGKLIINAVLPASLVLLLLPANLPAIFRLGRPALGMMLAASFGILLTAPLALLLFRPWLPPDAWKGLGTLSGSWIGGVANMAAVKEAVQTPESLFSQILVVDTLVAYSWMAVLLALAKQQGRFDRWNRSRTEQMDDLNRRLAAVRTTASRLTAGGILILLPAAGLGGLAAWGGAGLMPEVPGISLFTWTIILASALGIALSFTPARELEADGASKIGYFLLYLALAAMGARGNLAGIAQAPWLLAAGVVWLLLHALVLLVAARLFRAPLFLAVTASMANIGGPVSAPVVAAAYQPALASVGLLLAILGIAWGTYLGLACAWLCHWVQ